ncbi:hypothetical protein [Flavobacterium sedimenticola]|uniref:Uncharacterized protein n=1 Tax=Flavobacterium sedimenticola TaxID=3043286 RepID=A0ABT6XT11_9FLAO|nr:hypothetical protein [Flavobacterium sedimenticola]MDI9258238.1 hypothetical protein [Flavobacterium sedimenticola]
MLRISNKDEKYYYQLKTSQRNVKGKIHFESDSPNNHYLILEGIPWDEYAGDINKELKDDEWSGDENDRDNPKDISAFIGKDTLYIQNTGNSMNYYTILGECGTKYIVLIKQR